MDELVRRLLLSQMEAALCTLNVCVARCPDALWDAPVGTLTVNQVAFHTLFFTDYYLSPGDDEDAFKRQAFHADEAGAFRDYEELAERVQTYRYERPFLARYVAHCRRKAADVIAGETAASLSGPSGFSWRNCARAELHAYNTRHVQHHAAQLSLRLRLSAGSEVPWISHGWRDV